MRREHPRWCEWIFYVTWCLWAVYLIYYSFIAEQSCEISAS